jgi:hypothetical protein
MGYGALVSARVRRMNRLARACCVAILCAGAAALSGCDAGVTPASAAPQNLITRDTTASDGRGSNQQCSRECVPSGYYSYVCYKDEFECSRCRREADLSCLPKREKD